MALAHDVLVNSELSASLLQCDLDMCITVMCLCDTGLSLLDV